VRRRLGGWAARQLGWGLTTPGHQMLTPPARSHSQVHPPPPSPPVDVPDGPLLTQLVVIHARQQAVVVHLRVRSSRPRRSLQATARLRPAGSPSSPSQLPYPALLAPPTAWPPAAAPHHGHPGSEELQRPSAQVLLGVFVQGTAWAGRQAGGRAGGQGVGKLGDQVGGRAGGAARKSRPAGRNAAMQRLRLT